MPGPRLCSASMGWCRRVAGLEVMSDQQGGGGWKSCSSAVIACRVSGPCPSEEGWGRVCQRKGGEPFWCGDLEKSSLEALPLPLGRGEGRRCAWLLAVAGTFLPRQLTAPPPSTVGGDSELLRL